MDIIYIMWQELNATVPMQQRLDSAITAHRDRFGGEATHFTMPRGAADLGLSFPSGSEVRYVDHVQPSLIHAGHVRRYRANSVSDREALPISVSDREALPISVSDREALPISVSDREALPISVTDGEYQRISLVPQEGSMKDSRNARSSLLFCGIMSDDLDAAYAALRDEYDAHGRAPIFFNALKGARTYLRQKAAPWRLRPDMWFTGDGENRDRVRRGEPPIGYALRLDTSRCACMLLHPFKKGKNYPTCVHLQIVALYLRTLCDSDETATAPNLHRHP